MASKASKFVYEIAAEYSGQQSIRQLQRDLDQLGKIEGWQKAVRDWQDLNRQFNEAKARLREVQREMRGGGDETTRNRYAALTREVQTLHRALEGQRRRMREAGEDLRSVGIAASEAAAQYRRLQEATRQQGRGIAARQTLGIRSDTDIRAEITRLQNAYRDLRRSGTASLSELARAQTAMRTRIRQLTAETNGWTAATGRLHAGFAKVALGFGALRLGRAALDSLTQYDDAMRRVAAITGATAQEFAELDAKAQHLAATTRFSASEVAAAMQQLAAAGQTVGQIQSSIQAAMDIAAIAQMDVGAAADQLTNIMSQFGIDAQFSASVADALVAGFTGAATSMDQLANAMTYAGPVAHALGYSLEDTTAILMALANAGYKSERAGTSLRGGMTRLIRPMKMGREVLEKYSIAVFDAENRMRPFPDILEDIGRAGMTTAEMIKIFGQEAGPGMVALLSQGAGAIRNFSEQVRGSGDQARKLAEEMENGIGGAQRRLQAATDAMLRSFAGAAEPVLRPMIESLAELAGKIANMSPESKQAALAITTLVASLTALGGALKVLSLARFALTMGGLSSSLAAAAGGATSFAASIAAAGLVMKASFIGVLTAAVVAVGTLAHTIYTWREAAGEAAAAQERLKKSQDDLAKKYQAISEATGVTIKTHEQLVRAMKEGRIHFDETTKSWKKGAAERQAATEQQAKAVVKAEGEALKEMAQAYKQYADEIRRIQDDIAGRQKSLTAELREMARGGMTDADAWRDMRREAEEYVAAAKKAAEEARALAEQGDTVAATEKWKEAVALADDARSAYRNLNKEVREGDQTIISKAEALETAMQGVREAGELATDILKQQQKAAHDAMRELERDSGMAGLVAHLEDAERKWLESWERMSGAAESAINDVVVTYNDELADEAEEFSDDWDKAWERFEHEGIESARAVERAIDRAARDRQTTITVREGRRLGGLVGAPPTGYARGGKLPGYGGGDRIPALLESGEFVIRKEAVRRFGVGVFDALNHLRLPELPDLSALLPRMPAPGRTVNINLTLPSGDTYQMQTDPSTAARIEREQERWWALRSSNKVRRGDFARTR